MEGPLLTNSEHSVTIHGGSSSTAECFQWCDPCENVWNSIDFVVTLAQIVAAILLLTMSKDEQHHPQEIFLTFLIGYTCASVATLPVLYWRFWQPPETFGFSVDRQTGCLSFDGPMIEKYKKMLEYFFVGWVVLLVWHLIYTPALDYTSPHLWLCVAFLAISCIRDVYPNFPCAILCILFTLLARLAQLLDILDAFDSTVSFYFGIAVCVIGIIVCICNCCTRAS